MTKPAPSTDEAAAPELAVVPGPDRKIDLDAARRARREKQGPRPSVVFFGQTFPLPYGLPAKVIDLIGDVNDGDFTASTQAMKILVGGDVYDELAKKAEDEGDMLELEDVVELLQQALEIYEVTLPESGASGSSS